MNFYDIISSYCLLSRLFFSCSWYRQSVWYPSKTLSTELAPFRLPYHWELMLSQSDVIYEISTLGFYKPGILAKGRIYIHGRKTSLKTFLDVFLKAYLGQGISQTRTSLTRMWTHAMEIFFRN